MNIHIFKNNQQQGPYDESVVTAGLRDGRFLANDLACREGMTEWQPLSMLFPLETHGSGPLIATTPHPGKVPKCMVCGYVGTFQKEPLLAGWEIVTFILLLCLFWAGFVFLTIRLMRPKMLMCPKCHARGLLTYVY